MNTTYSAWPTVAVAMVLSLSACEFSNSCDDLVYNETLNQCECPEGSEPDIDRNGCVLPNGDVIPWGDHDVPYRLMDAGSADQSGDVADVGPPVDAGVDTEDVGVSPDMGPDAGPPPPRVRPHFPWNGFSTGSVHVPDGSRVVDHPLRPKLMWTAIPEADSYHVQMTRECAIEGFRSCAFDAPELDVSTSETVFRPEASLPVSMTAPVGSRYYWRVQSCTGLACSEWSEVRYLNVGRSPDDYNGDGYADLAVGALGQGNVFVFFGSADGVGARPDVTLYNPGEELADGFGSGLTSPGDLNGDGYPELVVSAAGSDVPVVDAGRAYIYFGSRTGLASEPDVIVSHPMERPRGRFGTHVSGPGDVNADGFADLLVGTIPEPRPTPAGEVFLYLGNGAGVGSEPRTTFQEPTLQEGSEFGRSSTGVGDVNGDGYSDFAIVALYYDGAADDEGRVFLYLGAMETVAASPSLILEPDEPAVLFGSGVATGDYDNDGYSDLAVAALSGLPLTGALGSVFILPGGEDGLASAPSLVVRAPLSEAGSAFGLVRRVGDLDGDGYLDLFIGAHLHDGSEVNEGRGFLYFGAETSFSSPSSVFANPTPQRDAWFGAGAQGSDFDGDGYSDLAVAAPAQSAPEENEGNVLIYMGTSRGPATSPSRTLDNPTDDEGGFFGIRLGGRQ